LGRRKKKEMTHGTIDCKFRIHFLHSFEKEKVKIRKTDVTIIECKLGIQHTYFTLSGQRKRREVRETCHNWLQTVSEFNMYFLHSLGKKKGKRRRES